MKVALESDDEPQRRTWKATVWTQHTLCTTHFYPVYTRLYPPLHP